MVSGYSKMPKVSQSNTTHKMAEHAQHTAELEIKKQQMDIEANGKCLKAEDHQIAAQHQHECKKEQHDMQIHSETLRCGKSSSISASKMKEMSRKQFWIYFSSFTAIEKE